MARNKDPKLDPELQRFLAEYLKAIIDEREFDIPGKASWVGYSRNGKPVVQLPNGKQIEVIKPFRHNPPQGATVYVDENGVIDGKDIAVPPKFKADVFTAPRKPRRKIKRRSFIPVEEGAAVTRTQGSIWTVYEEHFEQLPWTTITGAGIAPFDATTENLLNEFVSSGSISFWLNFNLFLLQGITQSFGFFEYFHQDAIFEPVDHPLIPEGRVADDYSFLCLIAAYNLRQYVTEPFYATDYFFLGSGSTSDIIDAFIGLYSNQRFGRVYVLPPGTSRFTNKVVGSLFHSGEYKVQLGFSRSVGVYPAKQYKINITNYELITDVEPSSIPDQSIGAPYMHRRFIVPDDIAGWNPLDYVYAVEPASNPIPGENISPADLTKFAAYSGDELFLNYIIKCYAPFENVNDALLVRYYPLNLRVNVYGQIDYVLGESTLNFADFSEGMESKEFPVKGNAPPPIEEYVTFTYVGLQDAPITTDVNVIAAVGGPTTSGQIPMSDYDEKENPYLVVQLNDVPPDGFYLEPTTGYYEFDPNVLTGLGPNDVLELSIGFTVLESNIANPVGTNGSINFTVYGSVGIFQGPEPPTISPPDLPDPYNPPPATNPAPVRTWDPAPIYQDGALDPLDLQVFDPVEVVIPIDEELRFEDYYLSVSVQVPVRVVLEKYLEPVVRLNDALYEDWSDYISTDVRAVAPRLLEEDADLIVEEGIVTGIRVRYTPEPMSLAFLGGNDVLKVTYKFKASLAVAPYVGNFEDLNDFPARHLRRELLNNAFPNDWRAILNPKVLDEETEELTDIDDENIQARDTDISHINFDESGESLAVNYVHAFNITKTAINRTGQLNGIVNNSVVSFSPLVEPVYEKFIPAPGEEEQWGLRYYLVSDTLRQRPLTEAMAIDVLNGSIANDPNSQNPEDYYLANDEQKLYPFNLADAATIVENSFNINISDVIDRRSFPTLMNLDDNGGRSWRIDQENSVESQGYLIAALTQQNPPAGYEASSLP